MKLFKKRKKKEIEIIEEKNTMIKNNEFLLEFKFCLQPNRCSDGQNTYRIDTY